MIFKKLDCCLNNYYKPRKKLFNKLLGDRVIDVLLHMPSYGIEKVYIEQLSQDDVGKIVTTKVKIDCIDINYGSSRPVVIYAKNGSGIIEILFFNYQKAYIKKMFQVGQEVGISGKLGTSSLGALQFINPEKLAVTHINEYAGIFNIYPLTMGLTQKSLYSVIKSAIQSVEDGGVDEWLPSEVIQRNGFSSFTTSLKSIHFPQKIYQKQLDSPFRRRIAFDELLAEQLVVRLSNQKTPNGYVINNEKTLINELLKILPFSLTGSQNKVLSEIFNDLESGRPMTRLLQGDVGSGKTIVAMIATLYAIESNYQCAILAPTEILARQHYFTVKKYFEQLGLNVGLLTGNERGKKREPILNGTADGTINMIVGTHAIITEKVNFQNLGLVIVDEQHRFGVKQRLQLIEKGTSPHVLSMTATPVPRTMIMSLYGDISVSAITEKPVGRKEAVTKSIQMNRILEVIQSIKNIINKGEKVYWICPIIEENEKLKYTCVINRFNFLKEHFGDKVEMLHGKMKSNEKQDVFEKFQTGSCKILVSTTVIEVGVDVPEATVICIENAEKFGLAQLHQLRGRVGRSDRQSYCILLYDPKLTEVAAKRIKIIKENTDGFKISEQDLRIRGGGEIFGVKQSGQKLYRTFDINDPENQDDIENLLEQASSLAAKIAEEGRYDKYNLLLQIFKKDDAATNKLSF